MHSRTYILEDNEEFLLTRLSNREKEFGKLLQPNQVYDLNKFKRNNWTKLYFTWSNFKKYNERHVVVQNFNIQCDHVCVVDVLDPRYAIFRTRELRE